MTKALTARTSLAAVLVLAIALLLSPIGSSGTANARGSHGHAAAKGSGKKSHKGGRGGRHHHRTYSLRGNPVVTRQVATALLAQKLPDLAALAGIQAQPASGDSGGGTPALLVAQASAPATAATAPAAAPAADGSYNDSELDESEDSDAITEEDYKDLAELPTDINSFYKEFTKYMASLNGEPTMTDNGVDKVAVMETLVDWIGTRYLFGGMGRNGIDCSAFTGTVYRALNFHLPRTAAAQWDVGIPVNREDLQFGDLIFFHTRQAVYVSHVGMYLGNGLFAHASSRNGVTVSELNSEYYSTHMIGARRYDLNAAMTASAESSEPSAHN
ncbi:MAG TPA: NlpC/P60 family protein [Candidatus Kapabacteria bacterium]|nr:NlpC/P60 family protein [Candidatus Kapabacteria bacterium]